MRPSTVTNIPRVMVPFGVKVVADVPLNRLWE